MAKLRSVSKGQFYDLISAFLHYKPHLNLPPFRVVPYRQGMKYFFLTDAFPAIVYIAFKLAEKYSRRWNVLNQIYLDKGVDMFVQNFNQKIKPP